MESIAVVVFLVRCSAGVLVCETVPAEHMRYAAMDTCRAEVRQLLSEKQEQDSAEVWMGKCLYRLSSPDPRRARRDGTGAAAHILRTADALR